MIGLIGCGNIDYIHMKEYYHNLKNGFIW